MIASKQKVKDICDRLMEVKPAQILIDFIQDDVEDLLTEEDVTPDDIGSVSYHSAVLLDVYNPVYLKDIIYLTEIEAALCEWLRDATFANKTLGLDPNK